MCGIYCVYKQSRSCQLPFCASPIFHFEIGDFSVYLYYYKPSVIVASFKFCNVYMHVYTCMCPTSSCGVKYL